MKLYKIDDQNGICVVVVADTEKQALKLARDKFSGRADADGEETHVLETMGEEFDAASAEVEEIDTDEPRLVGGFLY